MNVLYFVIWKYWCGSLKMVVGCWNM